MDEGRFAEACARLAESQRLDPAGGTLMNLARCRQLEGRTATSHALYTEALALARRDRREDRVEICQRMLSELEARLSRVRVEVPPHARAQGLVIKLNGAPLPALAWDTEIPVDPGPVRVEAEAPGRERRIVEESIAEGARITVLAPALPPIALPPPPPEARPAPPTRPEPSPPADRRAETAWRPAATARVDIDGVGRGAVVFTGVGVGVGRFLDLGVGALLGTTRGFEAGARAFWPLGAIRPFAAAAAPVFFSGRAFVGARLGAGVEWSVSSNVALFAQPAIAVFPAAPVGVERVTFVPSVGVVGRL